MGLTIHYSLAADKLPIPQARALVEKLRSKALELPFSAVDGIIELKGDDCRFQRGEEDPHAWLKFQSIRWDATERIGTEVEPLHAIAFRVHPRTGSEAAGFGLCRYPAVVQSEGHRIRTGLSGWSWQSWCKTQYSSNPTLGGMENFLKAHVGIISLLDYAKELGVLAEVKDEGKYWENRDVAALLKTVGEWNTMIAAAYGEIRDAIEASGGDPKSLKAEINKRPDFERLEAKGRTPKANEG